MRDLLTPAGQPARVSDKAADALLAMGWLPVAGGAAAAEKPKRKAPAKKKTASKKKSTKAGD